MTTSVHERPAVVRLGLRDSAAQFALLVAPPSWRASAVGVYRLWRDLGYAIGALLAGLAADAIGLSGALWLVAVITLISGIVAAVRMDETSRLSTA